MGLTWNFFLFSQNIQKGKIDSRIKELTPSHHLDKRYKHIEIIGFDVLDENKEPFKSENFFQEDIFYIVLYFKKKIVSRSGPSVEAFYKCKAVFEYVEGGYFWSKASIYNFYQDKHLNLSSQEQQIGGIYKRAFKFKIPKYATPGKYRLKLVKENDPLPRRGELLNIEDVVIHVQKKSQEKAYFDELNLSLDDCLLNPARATPNKIRYSWFGSAKFYINNDLKDYEKIIIIGKGSIYKESFSLLKISTEHKEIGEAILSSEYKEYEFELKLKKESHILDVQRFKGGGMTIKLIRLCK